MRVAFFLCALDYENREQPEHTGVGHSFFFETDTAVCSLAFCLIELSVIVCITRTFSGIYTLYHSLHLAIEYIKNDATRYYYSSRGNRHFTGTGARCC